MYFLTKDEVVIDNTLQTVYGIRFDDDIQISDISSDETAVAELIKRCNHLNLSPVHFYDVVEDFLSGI